MGVKAWLPRWLRRSRYINWPVERRSDRRVWAGPFAGMLYVDHAIGSRYLPKLIGSYERELRKVIEEIYELRPELVINVGAEESYYAVGLARRLGYGQVVAFEMEADGRRAMLAT